MIIAMVSTMIITIGAGCHVRLLIACLVLLEDRWAMDENAKDKDYADKPCSWNTLMANW